jgi:hypothetical protein
MHGRRRQPPCTGYLHKGGVVVAGRWWGCLVAVLGGVRARAGHLWTHLPCTHTYK